MRTPQVRGTGRQLTRRRFGLAVGALSLALTGGEAASASGTGAVPTQLRGMWIATVAGRDWPSPPGRNVAEQQQQGLLGLLDAAVEHRLNTVIFQVRPTADALWPSPYEPWSEYLTGVQGQHPGWDPLGFAVREAHLRGLDLHAWFNPYRIANHADPARLVPGHPARRNPGWVVPYGGRLYYNPGLPEVRCFVQDAMLDAVIRYDIDGVHWDDYFYPYPVAGHAFDDDAAYRRYGAGFADRGAWRRDNVDRLVLRMAQRVHAVKPDVRFGISPFGVWRNGATDPAGSATRAGVQSYDDLYADTRRWVREGWIDYVVPQVYWLAQPLDQQVPANYAVLAPWWADLVRGTGVDLYLGEALYKVGDPAQPAGWQDPRELLRHLDLCAEYPEIRGNVYFSASQVRADPLGAMTLVEDRYARRGGPWAH